MSIAALHHVNTDWPFLQLWLESTAIPIMWTVTNSDLLQKKGQTDLSAVWTMITSSNKFCLWAAFSATRAWSSFWKKRKKLDFWKKLEQNNARRKLEKCWLWDTESLFPGLIICLTEYNEMCTPYIVFYSALLLRYIPTLMYFTAVRHHLE